MEHRLHGIPVGGDEENQGMEETSVSALEMVSTHGNGRRQTGVLCIPFLCSMFLPGLWS